MARKITYPKTSAIALTAVLGAMSLAACNKSASDETTVAQAGVGLPLTVGDAAYAPAPGVDALPAASAATVRVADADDQYAYLDEAYYEGDAFEGAPPDYSFDYDGVSPWAWQGANDSLEFAEPVNGGDYRYYYYQPGQAYPYLVRDGGYSYGYDRGQLVVVYDSAGRPLSRDQIEGRRDYAGRYLARAQALYSASRSAQRRSVAAASWAAGQARIAQQRAQWSADRSRESAWQAYDSAHKAQQTANWQDERARRERSAQRFTEWRQADFKGPAPAPAGAGRRQDAQRDDRVREAQAQNQAQQRVGTGQALQQDHRAAEDQHRLADQQRQQQDQQRQQAEQNRQRDDQARQQADNNKRAQDQQRQQAEQQRQQQAQQKQQADNQHRAQQDQQRQQAEQNRQRDDQAKQQADNQRKAQQDQQKQRADQQRQEQGQKQQQAQQQRQQADQQRQQAENQKRQDQAQKQQQANQQRDQAKQQHDQQKQQAEQARKPKPGPESHPAKADEHRENRP